MMSCKWCGCICDENEATDLEKGMVQEYKQLESELATCKAKLEEAEELLFRTRHHLKVKKLLDDIHLYFGSDNIVGITTCRAELEEAKGLIRRYSNNAEWYGTDILNKFNAFLNKGENDDS